VSYLAYGDYRLAPDHPPLAKVWVAWPLLLTSPCWPGPDSVGWQKGEHFTWGEEFLFGLNNGQRLLVLGRCMMVVLLVATCAAVYSTARLLYGPSAGLLALALATLSPTMLAHGRLVTTDLPVTLFALLALLAFALLMERITWLRVLLAVLAFAGLSLVKFSWPLVLFGVLTMAVAVVWRGRPPEFVLIRSRRQQQTEPSATATCRWRCCLIIGLLVLFLSVTTWAAIWSCYGWRYPMLRDSETAGAYAAPPALRQFYATSWDSIRADAKQAHGLKAARLGLTVWLNDKHLFPEAYLYGFTCAMRTAEERRAYLMGEYSTRGWPAYFPIAFAIKTPIPTLLLLVAGIIAIAHRAALRRREPVLLAGLLGFAVSYGVVAVFSHLNIGHRHLLPVYPVVFILAGAAAARWTSRTARGVMGAAVLWLAIANARIYPHYVACFNEFVGGASNGYKYLADVDGGQDLMRLAAYTHRHSGESIQLASFGTVNPSWYGISSAALPSYLAFGNPAPLVPGTYVISVSQLLGVHDPALRDAFWADPQNVDLYGRLPDMTEKPTGFELPSATTERLRMRDVYEQLRRKRLINRLAHRQPDERIGYSLFVYHLSTDDLAELTRP
jgi:hypothetical protein